MNCLYKTTTVYTFEEYKRFSDTLFYQKRSLVIGALAMAFLIFDGIVLDAPWFILFAVIYPIVLWALHNRQVKKVFRTNRVLQNAEANFEFYDTYFVESNVHGTTTLSYDELYKIIITKTNVYLMIAKNQGYMLCKENFPEGLEAFLSGLKKSA